MKRLTLILSALLLTTTLVAQQPIDFFTFCEELDPAITDEAFVKQYKDYIHNSDETCADIHAETGNWVIDNCNTEGFKSIITVMIYPENNSTFISSEFQLTSSHNSDLDKIYNAIIKRYGNEYFHQENAILKDINPDWEEFGIGNISTWNTNETGIYIIDIPTIESHYIAILFSKSPTAKQYMKEIIDQYQHKLDLRKKAELTNIIDPIFYNNVRLGQDITHKTVLQMLQTASGKETLDETAALTQTLDWTENISLATIDGKFQLLNNNWDELAIINNNSKISSIIWTKYNMTDTIIEEVKNQLIKTYGEPTETLMQPLTYTWYGQNSHAIRLNEIEDHMLKLEFASTEKTNYKAITHNLQIHFLGTLDVGQPLDEKMIQNAIINSSEIFLNGSTLSPKDFIRKERTSHNSITYSITTPTYFAGEKWDFIVLTTIDNKLMSIEFQQSKDKFDNKETENNLEYWRDAFLNKYGIYDYIEDPKDLSKSYFWKDYQNDNIRVIINSSLSKSRGGELRSYLKITYYNAELLDQSQEEIQSEF